MKDDKQNSNIYVSNIKNINKYIYIYIYIFKMKNSYKTIIQKTNLALLFILKCPCAMNANSGTHALDANECSVSNTHSGEAA